MYAASTTQPRVKSLASYSKIGWFEIQLYFHRRIGSSHGTLLSCSFLRLPSRSCSASTEAVFLPGTVLLLVLRSQAFECPSIPLRIRAGASLSLRHRNTPLWLSAGSSASPGACIPVCEQNRLVSQVFLQRILNLPCLPPNRGDIFRIVEYQQHLKSVQLYTRNRNVRIWLRDCVVSWKSADATAFACMSGVVPFASEY